MRGILCIFAVRTPASAPLRVWFKIFILDRARIAVDRLAVFTVKK